MTTQKDSQPTLQVGGRYNTKTGILCTVASALKSVRTVDQGAILWSVLLGNGYGWQIYDAQGHEEGGLTHLDIDLSTFHPLNLETHFILVTCGMCQTILQVASHIEGYMRLVCPECASDCTSIAAHWKNSPLTYARMDRGELHDLIEKSSVETWTHPGLRQV